MKRLLYILFFGTIVLSSCINQSIMIKTPRDYKYAQFGDSSRLPEYLIAPYDLVQFQIYSNDGFRLVDLTSSSNSAQNLNGASLTAQVEYRVDRDGYLKFPLLGKTFLKGLSVRQAELLLEQKYSEFYNKPYVILKVTNKRVIIFPGQGGSAKVVPLVNENTTLFEALALAGGISNNGIAKRIKLIRGDLQNPKIFLIDASTIEGVKKADMNLQANDIIYVEPRKNVASEILAQLAPYVGLLTNVLLVVSLLSK